MAEIDLSLRVVRVVARRPDGYCEIEFAVGDPSLAVEMIIPGAALEDFCRVNGASLIEGENPTRNPDDPWDWNVRAATQQRLRGRGDDTDSTGQ